MDNLLLKSAAIVVALTLANEADAQQKAPVQVSPAAETKVKTDVKASQAAKEQLKSKVAGKGESYVKDGWFKVNKPADKSTPIEKVDVKKAASKVKN